MYFLRTMPTFVNLLVSLRPRQWTKNLFVFAALLFAQKLLDVPVLLRSLAAFAVFCALSGAVYLFNDIHDREADRSHPLKCRRPIARGSLGLPTAWTAALLLAAGTLAASWQLGPRFFAAAAAYVLVQAGYTLLFKHLVIIDVFALASGFVLRVVAGAMAISVVISPWLLVCTTLIALFLALCKRRHELTSLADGAQSHRKVLADYSAHLLDQMISVSAAATIITYGLYTMSEATVAKFGTAHLVYTVPFVIYGVFRYLYLVHRREEGGRPEQTLISDAPLLIGILLWALTVGAILYA
jgi:4-hydroxybenzoate polyprenyltransferase